MSILGFRLFYLLPIRKDMVARQKQDYLKKAYR
ncbi:hypothetical protein OKW24_001755 [Peribacillus simplex]|nr:hypothetical protein [Peribacillus simplex]